MQGHVSFPDFEDTLRQMVREEIARSRPPEQPSGYLNVESAAAYLDTTPAAKMSRPVATRSVLTPPKH